MTLFENQHLSVELSSKKNLYLVCITAYKLANKVNRVLKYYKDESGNNVQIREHEEAIFLVSKDQLNNYVFPTLRLRHTVN
jgi:hypothetical protein